MAKRFVIIRHAKSSWNDFSTRDFDRPLDARGKADAPDMGQRLLSYKLEPEAMYVSAAKRTQETARLISEAMQFAGTKVDLDLLYHAPASIIEDVISTADDRFNTIYIIAHNPGVTEFMIEHDHALSIENMPTCAIAAFEMEAESWADFHQAKKHLIKYDFPKSKNSDGQ